MKIDPEHKLFLGLKVDNSMKREIDQGTVARRPAFRAGDPARLDLYEAGEDLSIGRVIGGGFAVDDLDDLKRNIRSILTVSFPNQKPNGPLKLFAVDRNHVADLAAAS
jgi:hypothetical protein